MIKTILRRVAKRTKWHSSIAYFPETYEIILALTHEPTTVKFKNF